MERGRVSVVPIIMRRAESTRLTEARTSSKAAPSAIIASFLLKREPIQFLTLEGTICSTTPVRFCELRTRTLATGEEPNISSPSPWRLRLTLVLTTFWAFFEVASAMTMITPAISR